MPDRSAPGINLSICGRILLQLSIGLKYPFCSMGAGPIHPYRIQGFRTLSITYPAGTVFAGIHQGVDWFYTVT